MKKSKMEKHLAYVDKMIKKMQQKDERVSNKKALIIGGGLSGLAVATATLLHINRKQQDVAANADMPANDVGEEENS